MLLIRQLFRCVLQLFHGQSSEVRKLFSRIFHNFALKLVSVSLGAIIYYIVIQLVLTLGFDANLLKLLSASVVAVFLAVPYWKSKYFAKPAAKKAQKEDAKNA